MEMFGLFLGVKRNRRMYETLFCEAIVNVQAIRLYLGTRLDMFLGKCFDGVPVHRVEYLHPRELGLSPVTERNRHQNGGLFCSPTAFTAFRGTAEKNSHAKRRCAASPFLTVRAAGRACGHMIEIRL
jgi:hypothetical protein